MFEGHKFFFQDLGSFFLVVRELALKFFGVSVGVLPNSR